MHCNFIETSSKKKNEVFVLSSDIFFLFFNCRFLEHLPAISPIKFILVTATNGVGMLVEAIIRRGIEKDFGRELRSVPQVFHLH